jgi:hypothetical protein
MTSLDLDSTYLDFLIDSKSGDRIRWSWHGPLRELWYDHYLTATLILSDSKVRHKIYSRKASECTASDWIESLNGMLGRRELDWMAFGKDPGRLACLSLMDGPNLYNDSDLNYSLLCFIQGANRLDPWSITNTWIYPIDNYWLMSVTTMICPFNFPDEEDATALALAKEAFEKEYRVLYEHRLETATLEQWREQARAFLRQVYSHLETPFEIP